MIRGCKKNFIMKMSYFNHIRSLFIDVTERRGTVSKVVRFKNVPEVQSRVIFQ